MKKIIIGAVGGLLCVILWYNLFSQGGEDYSKTIASKRFEKERFFLSSPTSPIKDKREISKLAYFAPNLAYRVQARVEVMDAPTDLEIALSSGKKETYLRYAYLHFTLQSKEYKLLALRKTPYSPQLWVGFRDATSGKTTYGAGRYLDLDYRNGQKTVELDFNLAYNPYCAYSDGFACPIPPRENTLPTAIEAGEKNFEH